MRVSPGAKRAEVIGPYLDGWKVRVAAPPEDGRANAAVVRLLAEVLSVHAERVRIVSGHASRTKIVEVDDMSIEEVRAAFG